MAGHTTTMLVAVIAVTLVLAVLLSAFAIGGAGIVLLLALIGFAVVVGAATMLVASGRARRLPDRRDTLVRTNEPRGTPR